MITAREKGRSLELIVGGGDDMLSFIVAPINSAMGAQLLAKFLNVAFGNGTPEELQTEVVDLAQLALGREVYEQISVLRWAEQEQVSNAAFLWNIQGGGINVVQEYLTEGFPKARETLLRAVGLLEAFSLLQTSLSLGLENLTSSDDSPDTSTPSGSESSSEPLPPEPTEPSPPTPPSQ